MYTESSGVIHPTGTSRSKSENHGHGGVWVCRKCGWTYPNPHPSAKHRRNHKKHCGKIEGFNLISRTTGDSEERTISHSHSDDDYDDELMALPSQEHHKPPLPGPAPIQVAHDSSSSPGFDAKVPAVIETQGGALGRSGSSEEQVFSDAVPYFSDTDLSIITASSTSAVPIVTDISRESKGTIIDHMHLGSLAADIGRDSQESSDMTCDDLVQNPHASEITADHALQSAADTSKKTKSLPAELAEDRSASALEHEQTSLSVSTMQSRTNDTGENMINCSRTVVGPVLDAMGDENNCVDGGNLPAGPMLIESVVDGSGIDPELHKHQRVAHVEIFHSLADAELHKHHVVAEVDVLPSTIASDTSLTTTKDACLINDTVTSFGELGDSTVCHADEKQPDALEQKSYHYDPSLKTSHLEAIVVAVGEANTRFPDVIHEFDSIGEEHVSEYGIEETDKIKSCNAHGIADENMINCSRTVLGPVLDGMGNGNNCVGGNLPTGPMLIESDVDGSGIDPELHKHQRVAHVEIFHSLADAELHKHHGVAQVDVLPSTIASDTSLTTTKDAWLINDTVTSFGELGDSTVCHADEKQLDALEQEKYYLEAIVVAVGEDNTRFPDFIHEFDSIGEEHVSEYGIDETDKIKSCNAHGIAGENPPTISMLKPMELRVPITSAGDYVVEKTEGCIQDSNEMSAMISYLQQVGSEHLSSGSEINPNLSKGEAIVVNHDGAALGLTEMDGSPSPSQKNVLDCSFGGWEESGSHETLTAPVAIDSKGLENSDLDGKILAATLGDAVLRSTEIVAAPSSSQENRSNYSFAGQETCESRFSHETLMTPVALDSKVELKSIALTEVHFTDTGGDYNQDGATYEDSLVNPKLCTSESTNITSEELTKPPCHADTASDEFVTPSNITNNAAFLDAVVINSNGMGTNSNNQLGEVPECSPKQQIHQNEVLQENQKLSVSILEDHPVVNTEDEFEMENRDQHQGSSLIHASVLVVDALGDSISQADSVEGYWGSVEGYWGSVSEGTVPSELLSTPVMEALADNEVQFTTAEAGTGASLKHRNDTVEIFEAPSFITLVQPNNQSISAEIEPQNPLCPPLQAGWFPSQAHATKESEGRKRNEEMMAKVVNWASSGKPHANHTPLRNLLVEANLESKLHKKMMPPQSATRGEEQHSRQYEKSSESSIENKNKNPPPPLPVKLLHYDPPAAAAARKEWNSPARFPDAKREKRKGRRKPYWVTFVCCSSSIN